MYLKTKSAPTVRFCSVHPDFMTAIYWQLTWVESPWVGPETNSQMRFSASALALWSVFETSNRKQEMEQSRSHHIELDQIHTPVPPFTAHKIVPSPIKICQKSNICTYIIYLNWIMGISFYFRFLHVLKTKSQSIYWLFYLHTSLSQLI